MFALSSENGRGKKETIKKYGYRNIFSIAVQQFDCGVYFVNADTPYNILPCLRKLENDTCARKYI